MSRIDARETFQRAAGAAYAQLDRLDPYSRHKQFINLYVLSQQKQLKQRPLVDRDGAPIKSDMEVLRQKHKFLRSDAEMIPQSWEDRMAVKYYQKLFKEYCVADFSRYKENKFGMRWRTEREVFKGKGQFLCGNLACDERDGLESFEVNFSYMEEGEQKQALVKLRVCPSCAAKLHHQKLKKIEKIEKKRRKEEEKAERKRRKRGEGGEGGGEGGEKRDEEEEEEEVDEEEREEERGTSSAGAAAAASSTSEGANIWKTQVDPHSSATADDEMDDYLACMFP